MMLVGAYHFNVYITAKFQCNLPTNHFYHFHKCYTVNSVVAA